MRKCGYKIVDLRCAWISVCLMFSIVTGIASFPNHVIAEGKKQSESWHIEGKSEEGVQVTLYWDDKGVLTLEDLSMGTVKIRAKTGLTGKTAFGTHNNGRLLVGILPGLDEPPTISRLPVKSDPNDLALWIVPGQKQISVTKEGRFTNVVCGISDVGPGYRDQWLFILDRPIFDQGLCNTWFSPDATHVFLTEVSLLDFKFQTDPSYPLTFKLVAKQGYIHLCGKGTVTAPDGKVRSLGDDDTVGKWLPVLKSKDQLLREGTSQALGYLVRTREQKDKAIPALIKALKDPSKEVRRNVAEALGKIGDGRGIGPLNALLKVEKDPWVIDVTKDALLKLKRS